MISGSCVCVTVCVFISTCVCVCVLSATFSAFLFFPPPFPSFSFSLHTFPSLVISCKRKVSFHSNTNWLKKIEIPPHPSFIYPLFFLLTFSHAFFSFSHSSLSVPPLLSNETPSSPGWSNYFRPMKCLILPWRHSAYSSFPPLHLLSPFFSISCYIM